MKAGRRQKLFRVGKELKNRRTQTLALGQQVWPWGDREGKRGPGERTWRGNVQKEGGMCPIAAVEALMLSTNVLSEVMMGLGLLMQNHCSIISTLRSISGTQAFTNLSFSLSPPRAPPCSHSILLTAISHVSLTTSTSCVSSLASLNIARLP